MPPMFEVGPTELIARFLLDLGAMAVLLFGMFWPRYKNKEITLAAALFNVFTFGVLSILSSVEFSIAAGFGLFAILALFNLRSETINKSDIAYFFGSISIDRKSTRLNSSHVAISYAVFCLKIRTVDEQHVLKP